MCAGEVWAGVAHDAGSCFLVGVRESKWEPRSHRVPLQQQAACSSCMMQHVRSARTEQGRGAIRERCSEHAADAGWRLGLPALVQPQ